MLFKYSLFDSSTLYKLESNKKPYVEPKFLPSWNDIEGEKSNR